MTQYNTGLFIFRRDLRISDNTGLIAAREKCKTLHAVFCLDPAQIKPSANKFFSARAALFMIDSLVELKSRIAISIVYGDPQTKIPELIRKYSIQYLAFNEDYTPYARKRDAAIVAACQGIDVEQFEDVALNSPAAIKPYKVFTPYHAAAGKIRVKPPVAKTQMRLQPMREKMVDLPKLAREMEAIIQKHGGDLTLQQRGGRTRGLQCMRQFDSKTYKYRDLLSYESSRLSPHLKFGTVSPREVYHANKDAVFRKQLYWRDFYMQIGYWFPHVYGANYKGDIRWKNDVGLFKKWCAGKTGVDIIDACMSQLNLSGFMHNRGRMLVANYLTKILHVDWRWGERYFASRLTDYDPANNNGGWQWSAGTGVDAQPYYRIFNPYTQQDKFDPDGAYVQQWLKHKTQVPIADYAKERVVALSLWR